MEKEFSNEEKAWFYMLYVAEQLRADGELVMHEELSEEALDIAKRIVDSGFVPPDWVKIAIVQQMQEEGMVELVNP